MSAARTSTRATASSPITRWACSIISTSITRRSRTSTCAASMRRAAAASTSTTTRCRTCRPAPRRSACSTSAAAACSITTTSRLQRRDLVEPFARHHFTGNTVTTSASGIHTDNAGDSGGTADTISNNTVTNSTVFGYGIWVFVPYKTVTVQNNTVTNVDVGMASSDGSEYHRPSGFRNEWRDHGSGAGAHRSRLAVAETGFLFRRLARPDPRLHTGATGGGVVHRQHG